jgi:GxxExxY protein
MKLDWEQETFAIRGAIFEVYKELGVGFLESVYQECLENELILRGIPFQKQVELPIQYKGQTLRQYFKADLICYDRIIVELKACKALEPIHHAQVINYLKATGKRIGLLVNFHAHPQVAIERKIR